MDYSDFDTLKNDLNDLKSTIESFSNLCGEEAVQRDGHNDWETLNADLKQYANDISVLTSESGKIEEERKFMKRIDDEFK